MSVVVVYHSGYGHTAKVAAAVAEGANAALINVDGISDAQWAQLDSADAIIFGAPTYMGGVSAPFKAFIDAAAGRWFKRAWKDKIAAGFTNSKSYSGDKFASLISLVTNAMQHGMIWVGQAEIGPSAKGADQYPADAINRVGSHLGLMTQANDDSPEVTPPSGDLETARLFGRRVADITRRFHA